MLGTYSLDKTAAQGPDGGAATEQRLRKLALDNEDLRFECSRLRDALERAQSEIQALTERGTILQHRLDRIHGLAPAWVHRMLAWWKTTPR